MTFPSAKQFHTIYYIFLFTTAVRVGLIDSRFIVTESVDSSITVCAELQEGFLGRNISLMVVNVDSNGEIM